MLGLSSDAVTFESSTFGNLVLIIVLQFLTKIFACGLLVFFNFMSIREISNISTKYVWTDEQMYFFINEYKK